MGMIESALIHEGGAFSIDLGDSRVVKWFCMWRGANLKSLLEIVQKEY